MECAPPLYFDPKIDICNYPSEVDCVMPTTSKPEVSTTEDPAVDTTTAALVTTEEPIFNTTSEALITTEEPEFNTTSEAPITTEELEFNTTDSKVTPSRLRQFKQKNENITIVCPESTDGFPIFLPHPSNCSLYYECQGVWPILMECAPPLYFDPKIDICNYPSEVDCVMPTTSKPEVSTTEDPAVDTTTAALVTTEEPIFNTTSEAPITTEEPEFNTTSEAPITSEEPEFNTTDSEVTPSGLRQFRQKNENITIVCPVSTDGFPVFLPHPSNCSLYYECQGDWPILMECAPPLYFDSKIDICNYPSEVDCVMPTTTKPEVSTTEPMINTTSVAPITTEEPSFNTTSEAPITTEVPVSNITTTFEAQSNHSWKTNHYSR